VLVEVPREHERQRELHHLGRLEARDADMQPAAGAVRYIAEESHRHKQRDPDHIGGDCEAHHRLRMHLRDEPHRDERDGEVHDLRADSRRHVVASREKREQAEHRERKHQHEERAVDAFGEAAADALRQREAGELHQSPPSTSSSFADSSSGVGVSIPGGTLPSMK